MSGDVMAMKTAAAWAVVQGMSPGEGRSQDTQTGGRVPQILEVLMQLCYTGFF